jgi:AhpD family alkylhydroperoxidase
MTHARSEYKDFMSLTPDAYAAVLALSQVAAKAGMDKQLLELVKLRASQINGCAFCVQHHILESEKLGVPADKLNLVVVWREAPQFSPRERAALAWTEALTLIAETHAPDAEYEAMRAQFSESEAVNLTMLIGAINAWNRVAIGFRAIHPVKARAAA